MGIETLAIASLAGSVIGGAVSAVGAMQQASAQKSAAEYQSAVARNNQIIAQQNADRAAQAGRVQAQTRDMRTRAIEGQIEAAQSAGGIDIGSGSSREVRESALQIGRFDARTTLDSAMLQARAAQVQGMNFGAEAQLQQMKASSISPFMSALPSLIGTVSSFSDKWLGFQQKGVFSGGVSGSTSGVY